MRIIQMKPDSTNVIGRAGENLAVQARFRVTEEYLSRYGEGIFTLCLLRPEDSEPYAVQTEIDGGDLVWNVTATDTQQQGFAYAELQYQAGSILAKSVRYRLFVEPSLGQASEEPPEPWQRWVDDVLAAGNAAVLASQTAADSAQQAAQSAEDTEAAAQRAETAADRPYLSLERLGPFLYDVSFDAMPPEVIFDDLPGGGCSSYVQGGKLYRNLDWAFTETASFRVRCKEFVGMSFVSEMTDGDLDDDLIAALPFRVTDGINTQGIMVSTHVLFNDWDWHGSGSTPLTILPYRILTGVKSMATLEDDLADVLSDLTTTPALDAADYLLQFLVTDGETTCAILPPESAGGNYAVVDITDNPKLANFRWVEDSNVSRADLQLRPTGVERWNLMPTPPENLRFSKAYEAPTRLSEFIGIDGTTKASTDAELEAIYETAHALYEERERDGRTWQTMHSVVYSAAGMEALYVQEDWNRNYVSAGSSGSADEVWLPSVSEEGTISWQRSASTTAPAARNMKGLAGADGQDGAPGVGVPEGGTTGQVLAKKSGTDYDTEWVTQSGGGGTGDHTQLTNRDASNQHPISAINGLQSALDAKGTYSKPTGGIPKSDLASGVQTSLGKADTAVQPETGKGLFSGSYNDLTNKPTIRDAFLCTYGTTTFDEISAALAADKQPVCYYDGCRYDYVGISNGYHCFTAVVSTTARRLYVKTTWGSATLSIASSGDIPSEFIKSASVSQDGETLTLTKKDNTTVVYAPAGGGGGTTDHRQLSNRDASGQHPISAITGLQSALDSKSTFSGDYEDLTNKPTIPAEVTESTVSGWGFTKNTGTYSKPSSGIPKTDLASAVQTSLGKADTAVQPESGKGLFSGSYTDLTDKPTIPSAVTESTVAGWGFTKNTGTYSKPTGGIPKSDLASAVQTSLGKADSALQSESDPIFSASPAAGITSNDISGWNGKEPAITAGTTSQYLRGDKTWQTLDKSAVGLGNVQNASINRSTNVNAADTGYTTLMARGEKLLDATTFDGVTNWGNQLVNGAIAWKYE